MSCRSTSMSRGKINNLAVLKDFGACFIRSNIISFLCKTKLTFALILQPDSQEHQDSKLPYFVSLVNPTPNHIFAFITCTIRIFHTTSYPHQPLFFIWTPVAGLWTVYFVWYGLLSRFVLYMQAPCCHVCVIESSNNYVGSHKYTYNALFYNMYLSMLLHRVQQVMPCRQCFLKGSAITP